MNGATSGCAGCPVEHASRHPPRCAGAGYQVNTCTGLRLWRAEATENFDFLRLQTSAITTAAVAGEGEAWRTSSKGCSNPNDGTARRAGASAQAADFFVSCSLQECAQLLDLRQLPVSEFRRFHWAVAAQRPPTLVIAVAEADAAGCSMRST